MNEKCCVCKGEARLVDKVIPTELKRCVGCDHWEINCACLDFEHMGKFHRHGVDKSE